MMVRMDGAEARKERMTKILQHIHSLLFQNKETGQIPLKKTVAGECILTGLTPEKVMEYLELQAQAGHFILDVEGDRIVKIES